MQSVSADFTTATQAAGRQPIVYLEVSWDNSGAFTAARASAGWTDESDYLVRHSGSLHINPPGEKLVPAGQVGTATVVVDNTTQRFSWKRTDKPLYANIGGAAGLTGKRIRIWQGFVTASGNEYVCIFSGFIVRWQESTQQGQATFYCQDRGWRLLQDKHSTAVYQEQRADEWIAVVMGLAGFTSSHWMMDVGLFPIPYCWMDDESIVQEVWDTAEADGGVTYFDQLGKLHFENLLHWTSGVHLTSQWTFDEGTYKLSDPQINVDALATKVVVEWSGRSQGADADVYELDVAKTIGAGDSVDWVARYDYAALSVYDPSADDPYNDYTAVSFAGIDMTSDITVALSNKYGQQCTVTATNNGSQPAVLTYLRIRGQPLLGGPTEQSEVSASPAPLTWDRIRSVRGNPYIQTMTQGDALANVLALRGRVVRPFWRLSSVPGVPQLELTDRVTFEDDRALGSGNSIDGIVTSIDWRFGLNDGFVQEITVMDVTDLAAYSDYYVIGTTALGSNGRAYY